MPKFDWLWRYLQRYVVCLTAGFMDIFVHWISELIGLLYDQMCISDMCYLL